MRLKTNIYFSNATHTCFSTVYSFGIPFLELASGRKPIVDVSSTMKNAIIDWALPLVCEKKFSEIVDPRLNGNYVEEELKRVIVVCSKLTGEETNHD